MNKGKALITAGAVFQIRRTCSGVKGEKLKLGLRFNPQN